MPKGRTIYLDTDHLSPNRKNLYDPNTGITGRPDYLVKSGNQIIPVELKSSTAPKQPYYSHILQLGAYCLLVDQLFEIRPDFGILHYPDRTYRIPYTRELEKQVLETISAIDSQMGQPSMNRSHGAALRCRHCGYRENCDQRLL